MIKTISLIATILFLWLTPDYNTSKPKEKILTSGQQERMITITMPERYWGVVIQGLQELPAKISNQVSDSIINQYRKQVK